MRRLFFLQKENRALNEALLLFHFAVNTHSFKLGKHRRQGFLELQYFFF